MPNIKYRSEYDTTMTDHEYETVIMPVLNERIQRLFDILGELVNDAVSIKFVITRHKLCPRSDGLKFVYMARAHAFFGGNDLIGQSVMGKTPEIAADKALDILEGYVARRGSKRVLPGNTM